MVVGRAWVSRWLSSSLQVAPLRRGAARVCEGRRALRTRSYLGAVCWARERRVGARRPV